MRRASLGAESGSFKGLNHETSTHKRINRGANSDRQVAKRETRKAGTQAGTQDPQGKAIETQLEIGESRHMKLKRIHFLNVSEAASTAEDRRQYRRARELQVALEGILTSYAFSPIEKRKLKAEIAELKGEK